jgi:threonine synthase
MASVQPAHYNALERALAEPARDPRELATAGDRLTVLTKLAHTFPPDGLEALDCLRATDGAAVSVGDEEALAAQAELGRQEGLFVEPSSAAALAGLRRLVERGAIAPAAQVVVCLTGNGFRELGTLPAVEPGRVATIPATEPATWLARFLEAGG